MLARLAGQLAEGLRRKAVRGRTIAIKVRLDDWTTVTRARTLAAPVNDTATITGVAIELLRAYAPPRPVRLLGVRVAAFEDARGGGAGAPPPGAPRQLALRALARRQDRPVAAEAELRGGRRREVVLAPADVRAAVDRPGRGPRGRRA